MRHNTTKILNQLLEYLLHPYILDYRIFKFKESHE